MSAHKILNLECSSGQDRTFAKKLVSLEKMRDYLSNMIFNCQKEVNNTIDRFVIFGVLLRQYVAMLDAFCTVARTGNYLGSDLPARAMFENFLQSHWILMQDVEERARIYWVRNVVIERYLGSELAIPSTKAGGQFKKAIVNSTLAYGSFERFESQAQKDVKYWGDILNNEYSNIANDFWNSKKGTYDRTKNWYHKTKVNSVRDIANKLGCDHLYLLFYGNYSKTMHGSAVDELFSSDSQFCELVRDLSKMEDKLTLVRYITTEHAKKLLSKYRVRALASFEKNVSKWSIPWMSN